MVVARTRASVSRRASSSTKPTSMTSPESVPAVTDTAWYWSSDTPSVSVSDAGMSSPSTCPPMTASRPEVEQEHRRPQPPALEELGGARGPAELVVAVAPDVPDHEHGHGGVGQDDPQQQVDAAHRRPPGIAPAQAAGARRTGSGITSGGAKGSRPTDSPGGPSRARRRSSSRSSAPQLGQHQAERRRGAPRRGSRRAPAPVGTSSITGRYSASRAPPPTGSSAANSSITGRWSGSSGPSSSSPDSA